MRAGGVSSRPEVSLRTLPQASARCELCGLGGLSARPEISTRTPSQASARCDIQRHSTLQTSFPCIHRYEIDRYCSHSRQPGRQWNMTPRNQTTYLQMTIKHRQRHSALRRSGLQAATISEPLSVVRWSMRWSVRWWSVRHSMRW